MKVFVYYNLHKKLWSVKALEGNQKGRVIAHLESVEILNAVPKVSEAGRQRVLRERRKNVHAGVVGFLLKEEGTNLQKTGTVSYNPYKCGHFFFKDNDKAWQGSRVAVLNKTRTIDVFDER